MSNEPAGGGKRWPRRHWVGRAALSPLDYVRQRRRLRMEQKTSSAEKASAWADQNGFALHVYDNGQHWIWQKDSFIAEWWPSSAKLVFNREYHHTVHAHDWKLVVLHLAQHRPHRTVAEHPPELFGKAERPRHRP